MKSRPAPTIRLYKKSVFDFYTLVCYIIDLVDTSTMILRAIFVVSIVTIGATQRPVQPLLGNPMGQGEWQMARPTKTPPPSETVVENKNVNIVVNVDPKDVAKELWSLIQSRLDGRDGRRSMTNQHTIDELERIVSPIISPTRRSHSPTAFELAYALDHATRKALLNDNLKRPTFEDEIDTREIVASMMIKLRSIMETNNAEKTAGNSNFRRMLDSNDDSQDFNDSESDDDGYVNVVVKIRKSEIRQRNDVYPDDYS